MNSKEVQRNTGWVGLYGGLHSLAFENGLYIMLFQVNVTKYWLYPCGCLFEV